MWSSRLDRPQSEINREICVSRSFPEAKSQIEGESLLNWTALPSRRSFYRDWCRFSWKDARVLLLRVSTVVLKGRQQSTL